MTMHEVYQAKLPGMTGREFVRQLYVSRPRGSLIIFREYEGVDGLFLESPSGRVRLVPEGGDFWALHLTDRPSQDVLEFLVELRTKTLEGKGEWVGVKRSLCALFQDAEREPLDDGIPHPATLDLSPVQQNALDRLERISRCRRRWVPAHLLGKEVTVFALVNRSLTEYDERRGRVRLPVLSYN